MFLAHDRPDIMYACKELARFAANPHSADLIRAKRLARYLKGYPTFTWHFHGFEEPTSLVTWVDSDWAGQTDTRKSTSGGIVLIGSCCVDAWSRTQVSCALSSAEAEYVAMCIGATRTLGIQTLLSELGHVSTFLMKSDSRGALLSAATPGSLRMKHLQLKWHLLKDLVSQGVLQLAQVATADNIADVLTKAVTVSTLATCLSLCKFCSRT